MAKIKGVGPAVMRAIQRRYNLRFNYRLSGEDHTGMLVSQDWRCANRFCPEVDSDDKRLQVDHDHACCDGRKSCGKCVRGLLCNTCNRILGLVNDDERILIGLAEYVKAWKTLSVKSGSETMMTI